ncbi:beta-galactosidase-1-like protein 2 isoform X1 [Protopterus annectens]|uniref:beta-galactosidase-1-like protein 2 isoform X1 n=2 Tax=Protopterus annectens TaxID=7888 RepID=UPI001CFA5061|nr:beta-galactosidase-1-like protein 2 isoform X1 [Protopterus annectens]
MLIFTLRKEHRRRLLALVLIILVLVLYRINWSGLTPAKMSRRNLGLQAESEDFTLEGEKFRIFGGSLHYFRVPKLYWRDRMLKMKACGLNTLTTYVAWNLHEPQRGHFDFTDNLDIVEFIKVAEEVGLWVLLRPGPYICSEWELGGLPSWLLRDPGMKLRTTYKGFIDAVDSFFDQLLSLIMPLQYKKGGPIIAFQVENEYGAYAKDPKYLTYVKQALVKRGVVELLMTSDNKEGTEKGHIDEVLAAINFKKLGPGLVSFLDKVQPNKPKMVMEYWTGWFDFWGGLHHVFKVDEMMEIVGDILQKGFSINLYMFHGGTNFGFMNGATDFNQYKPLITSYDYDAPLSEAGDLTLKYHKLRELFHKYIDRALPDPPPPLEKAEYKSIEITGYLPLQDTLQYVAQPISSKSPINMENLPFNNGNGQSYGYTLYETIVSSGGKLNSVHVHDRAQVFVDDKSVGILDYNIIEITVPEVQGNKKLSVLVENCGRVNYGEKIDEQHKGLVGDILLNGKPLENFRIYALEMQPDFLKKLGSAEWKKPLQGPLSPGFFRAVLKIDSQPLDTFLALPDWEKGVVFVNGKNLGRYWNIGPARTLYLPAPWLHKGDNEIVIFEEHKAGKTVHFQRHPVLGDITYDT